MTREEMEEFVERTTDQLGEHFDAVQILVSGPASEGGTFRISRGSGNWYARQGMAHEFIAMDRAQEQANEIARQLKPDEPE
jgi:hypothetical protein